jgi:hypothetical protein
VSFLAPIWLALAAAVAVPLVLHLMRRRIETRRDFPAARYLLRAERENVRKLKLRNLLLMVLRALAVLFLALAAARPISQVLGSGHVPTGLAIVVDNSMSAGVIVDGAPLLARLKAAARGVVDAAGGNDRVWLVTVDGSVTGGARDVVADAIDAIEAIGGQGDLQAAITRAAGLASEAGLPASTVVIVTDGQASQWVEPVSAGAVRAVAWMPAVVAPENRSLAVAEPRPARWSPRGAVLVRAEGADSVTFRVTLGERTVSRGLLRGSAEHLVRLDPAERGWQAGRVDLAPDELRGDDERHFAVWVGSAPTVTVDPASGLFVREAIDALVQSELIGRGPGILIAPADLASQKPALLLAPSDPVRLGAANRALERLGVPWRLGEPRRDETVARGADLDGMPIRMRYPLQAVGGAASDTLVTASGEPWAVAGDGYVLVASPVTVEASGLPIRAQFLPWLTELVSQRLAAEGAIQLRSNPGGTVRWPAGIDGLERNDGQVVPIQPEARAPLRNGVYFLRRGTERVGALVVNAELEESQLDRLGRAALTARLRGDQVIVAADQGELVGVAFDQSARRPLQALLLFLALAALVAEMVIVRRAEPRGRARAA